MGGLVVVIAGFRLEKWVREQEIPAFLYAGGHGHNFPSETVATEARFRDARRR